MYLTRAKVSKKVPISRKGTKYVAKALSHSNQGIPVVVAIRDLLGLARTSKEVKLMVNEKKIKLNGKVVKDIREGIRLLNILEANKKYRLMVLKTGRFVFEESKENNRVAKIIGKKVLSKGKIQFNLHDGTNVLIKEKANIGDSVYLDSDNKVTKVISLDKGKEIFVLSGGSIGSKGKVKVVDGKKVQVQLEDGEVTLDSTHIIAL